MDEHARQGGRTFARPGTIRLLVAVLAGGLCGSVLTLAVTWQLTGGFRQGPASTPPGSSASACQARLALAETAAAAAGQPVATATVHPARPTMTLRVAARSAPSAPATTLAPPSATVPASAMPTTRPAPSRTPTEVPSMTAPLTRTPEPQTTERATATLRITR